MKGENNNIRILVWVSVNIFSLVLSVNICGKADEPVLISYTTIPSADSVQWKLNSAFFFISTLNADGLTCRTPPFPAFDYEVLCSNAKVSGSNYFGLNILKPKDGDSYYTTDPNDNRTIIVSEPANMTVDITSPVTTYTVLPSTDTISMECQISSCTKRNIMWQYTTDGGATNTTISNTYIESTSDATSCTGTSNKINSTLDISKDSVPIIDVPFKVVCVLSYDVCSDNKYDITDYTITITDQLPTTTSGTPGPDGLPTWAIVVIVIAVIVIVVLLGVGWFCYKKREKKKDGTVPDPPLDINYKTRSADNIVVTWRAGGGNGGGPQTFIVQQSQDNKRWTDSTTKPTPLTEYSIENLQPDTTYYIRVIATNKHGDSDPEKGIVLLVRTKKRGPPEPPKPQGVPDPPLDINYKTRGADNIVVTWRPSGNGGDQQQFIVQQSKDNKHWTDSTTKPIPLNEYSIEKLQPDTAYYIRVVARNKHGDSQPEQGIVLLIRTKKQDSSSTAVGKRRREDPENGVELTDRVSTPLNS